VPSAVVGNAHSGRVEPADELGSTKGHRYVTVTTFGVTIAAGPYHYRRAIIYRFNRTVPFLDQPLSDSTPVLEPPTHFRRR
jgi:hypothetical protein